MKSEMLFSARIHWLLLHDWSVDWKLHLWLCIRCVWEEDWVTWMYHCVINCLAGGIIHAYLLVILGSENSDWNWSSWSVQCYLHHDH